MDDININIVNLGKEKRARQNYGNGGKKKKKSNPIKPGENPKIVGFTKIGWGGGGKNPSAILNTGEKGGKKQGGWEIKKSWESKCHWGQENGANKRTEGGVKTKEEKRCCQS